MLKDPPQTTLRIGGMDWRYFLILLAIAIASVGTGNLGPGLIGILPVMMIVGALLDQVGSVTPGIRGYLGGGPIVVIFGSAACVAYLPVDPAPFTRVAEFMKGGGFLDFYIAALITGSILGMERRFLIHAAARYLPVMAGAVLVALLLAGLTGSLLEQGFSGAVLLVGIPIMGGGMGAGAIPLAEIMARSQTTDTGQLLSQMAPAVALGNALAIVSAGILGRLGSRFPFLGDGSRLMRDQHPDPEPVDKDAGEPASLGVGFLLAAGFFAVGRLLGTLIPVHPYALMILLVAGLKMAGVVGREYELCAARWFRFVMANFTHALLVGIGVAFTDLHTVLEAITPAFFAIVLSTVVGAAVGAAATGHLLGFFPIEASITGGLCMANMGGTGDVAVLSAARRMHLMPFAQISSRLGGAFIIILTSALVGLFGAP